MPPAARTVLPSRPDPSPGNETHILVDHLKRAKRYLNSGHGLVRGAAPAGARPCKRKPDRSSAGSGYKREADATTGRIGNYFAHGCLKARRSPEGDRVT